MRSCKRLFFVTHSLTLNKRELFSTNELEVVQFKTLCGGKTQVKVN
jgi:hypothetical protein